VDTTTLIGHDRKPPLKKLPWYNSKSFQESIMTIAFNKRVYLVEEGKSIDIELTRPITESNRFDSARCKVLAKSTDLFGIATINDFSPLVAGDDPNTVSIVFEPGQNLVKIPFTAINDNFTEGVEVMELTLTGEGSKGVVSNRKAIVIICDPAILPVNYQAPAPPVIPIPANIVNYTPTYPTLDIGSGNKVEFTPNSTRWIAGNTLVLTEPFVTRRAVYNPDNPSLGKILIETLQGEYFHASPQNKMWTGMKGSSFAESFEFGNTAQKIKLPY
jgi:hypothetical protein